MDDNLIKRYIIKTDTGTKIVARIFLVRNHIRIVIAVIEIANAKIFKSTTFHLILGYTNTLL